MSSVRITSFVSPPKASCCIITNGQWPQSFAIVVYGITEHPMMLATNKEIKSKDDVIRVARIYFSRWKIEEYFRCKKQMFQFENFRVRKLKAINALNFYITLCMAFLAMISMESATNALKVSIIKI